MSENDAETAHSRTPSPFPPPSNSLYEADPQQRRLVADRWQRFMSYLKINNITANRPTSRRDSDLFFSSNAEEPVEFEFTYNKEEQIRVYHSKITDNYKIYDVHKEQIIRTISLETHQLAERYDDSLGLKELNTIKIVGFPFAEFKNNIVECWNRYVFCCAWSRLIVLKDDCLLEVLETRPQITLRQHINASVNTDSPHSINYLKIVKFKEKDCLVLCCDDGRGVLYDLNNYQKDGKLNIMIQFEMNASVWGVDAFEDYIVFSDNSQRVTLFYHNGSSIYFKRSVTLSHNITDVKIVGVSEEKIFVVCSSISSELVTFQFLKKKIIGPSDKPLKQVPFIDSTSSTQHVQCEYEFDISVVNRALMRDHGWSVHCIDKKYFRKVHNPEYLGYSDSHPIDEKNILLKSQTLDTLENQLVSSNFGGAAKYETIHINTRFERYSDFDELDERFNNLHDQINRIKKDYLNNKFIPSSLLQNNFYIISTNQRVGLFRSDGLIRNSDTAPLLPIYDFEGDTYEYLNRFSIARAIPEISTYIAVSQVGFIVIFRMVEYRGLYSLREEFSIPMLLDLRDPTDDLHITIGCGIRKVYDSVYWIYIMDIHGSLRKIELCENDNDKISVTFL